MRLSGKYNRHMDNSSQLKSDISSINCTADNCRIEIAATADERITVDYSRGIKVWYDGQSAQLNIRQRNNILSKIFRTPKTVRILVPGHIVPALCVSGDSVQTSVEGGIYGGIECSAKRGSLRIENAAMESCSISGGNFDLGTTACTVRGSILALVEQGDISLEHTFASHINCRTKCGNVGAISLNCKDTLFEVGEGSVTATIVGDESTFDVIVNAKEGTCNKESLNIEGNEGAFKAYVAKGNIFVDFQEKETEAKI